MPRPLPEAVEASGVSSPTCCKSGCNATAGMELRLASGTLEFCIHHGRECIAQMDSMMMPVKAFYYGPEFS